MTVKKLIEKLNKVNPEATICLETKSNPEAKELYLVSRPDKGDHVYITDDLSMIIDELAGDGFKVKKIK